MLALDTRLIALFLTIVAVAARQCQKGITENVLLWRFRDREVYLFGTAHLPHEAIWPRLPQHVRRTLLSADILAVELDMTRTDVAAALRECRNLDEGRTIAEIIPPALYERVRRLVKKLTRRLRRGLQVGLINDWAHLRPTWLALLLNNLAEVGASWRSSGGAVLDEWLARRYDAVELETVAEQCEAINGLPQEQSIAVLEAAVLREERDEPRVTRGDLVEAYLCGDIHNVTSEIDTDDPIVNQDVQQYMAKIIVAERNEKMANRMAKLLEINKNKTIIFAIGIGHFIGENSIISILERKKYLIEKSVEVVPITIVQPTTQGYRIIEPPDKESATTNAVLEMEVSVETAAATSSGTKLSYISIFLISQLRSLLQH